MRFLRTRRNDLSNLPFSGRGNRFSSRSETPFSLCVLCPYGKSQGTQFPFTLPDDGESPLGLSVLIRTRSYLFLPLIISWWCSFSGILPFLRTEDHSLSGEFSFLRDRSEVHIFPNFAQVRESRESLFSRVKDFLQWEVSFSDPRFFPFQISADSLFSCGGEGLSLPLAHLSPGPILFPDVLKIGISPL